MLLAMLIVNSEGNILVERFNGVPAEERLHWRSFLVTLGAENLKGVKNEEFLVASHNNYRSCRNPPELLLIKLWKYNTFLQNNLKKRILIPFLRLKFLIIVLGDISIYVVGKDEYDELALAETIFVITSALKDACEKPPTERLFLDKYGKICLCLDEIVWKFCLLFVIVSNQMSSLP